MGAQTSIFILLFLATLIGAARVSRPDRVVLVKVNTDIELECDVKPKPSHLIWSETVTTVTGRKVMIIELKGNDVTTYENQFKSSISLVRKTSALRLANVSIDQHGAYFCSDSDIENVVLTYEFGVLNKAKLVIPDELLDKRDYKLNCSFDIHLSTSGDVEFYFELDGEKFHIENELSLDSIDIVMPYRAKKEDNGKVLTCKAEPEIKNFDHTQVSKKLNILYPPSKPKLTPTYEDIKTTDRKIVCSADGNPKPTVKLTVNDVNYSGVGESSISIDKFNNETIRVKCEASSEGHSEISERNYTIPVLVQETDSLKSSGSFLIPVSMLNIMLIWIVELVKSIC